MNTSILKTALLGLCLAGSLSYGSGAPAEELPAWLQEALAREGNELETSTVLLQAGSIVTVITGKLIDSPEDFEGGAYVQTDIGGGSPLECIAYNFRADPAALAVNLAEEGIAAAVAADAPLNARQLTAVRSAAYDGIPYHYVEWTYSLGEPTEARLYMIKVGIAYLGDTMLACSHNELGFRQTFAASFERFVRNAEKQHESVPPYYEEVIQFSLGQQSLGYSSFSLALDADGDTVIETLTSMLSPRDAQTLTSSDGWTMAYSTPDGLLINQSDSESSDGELTYALDLQPMGETEWEVSGEFRGKPFSAVLDAAAAPPSDLGQMRLLRQLVNDSERTQLSFPMYAPGTNPGEFMHADVTLDPRRRATGGAQLAIGPVIMEVDIDADGSMPRGTLDLGIGEMRIERIWQAGEID